MKQYLIATLVLTGFTLHAFDSTLEFRHRESQGVGYNQGYSTIEFIGNQNWEKWEFLLDVRGHIFNNGKLAANTGFGFRKAIKDERYLLGLNAFYDVRETSNLTAQQIGIGAEFIGREADFRMNGYIPFAKQSDFEQRTFSGFSGFGVYVKQRAEITLPCIEAEIGVPIKSIFYIAGGPYYLFNNNTHGLYAGKAWGGRLRAVLDVTDFLSLSAIVTHDRIFKTRVQGYLSFNIALEKFRPKKAKRASMKPTAPSSVRNLRKTPITRNEIIPIEKKHRTVSFSELSADGHLTSFIFVNNAFKGIGKGTFEEPFTSLKEAEQASKPGDVIYVLPGDGTSHNMEEGIILKENQMLTSSGIPLKIEEVIVPAQTPGQKPVITNVNADQPIVTHAEGSKSQNAFTVINPSDYIFSDWDSPSYEFPHSSDLLGGDSSGAVTNNFGEPGDALLNIDFSSGNPDAGDHSASPPHVTGSEPASDEGSSSASHDSFAHVESTDVNFDNFDSTGPTDGDGGAASTSTNWWPW